MLTPGYCLVLLLAAEGCPDLSGGPLRLGIPQQARVDTSLLEAHPPRDPGPDLSGPAETQRL